MSFPSENWLHLLAEADLSRRPNKSLEDTVAEIVRLDNEAISELTKLLDYRDDLAAQWARVMDLLRERRGMS